MSVLVRHIKKWQPKEEYHLGSRVWWLLVVEDSDGLKYVDNWTYRYAEARNILKNHFQEELFREYRCGVKAWELKWFTRGDLK